MAKRDQNRVSREDAKHVTDERGEERTFVRTPLGKKKDILTCPKVEGYHVHIINEENVPAKLEQGYRFLEAGYRLGDKVVSSADNTGSVMTRDVGQNKTGYVMILSDEYREEDNKIRRDRVMSQAREPLDNLQGDEYYGHVKTK